MYAMQDANTIEGMQSSDYTRAVESDDAVAVAAIKINELSIDVKSGSYFWRKISW